MRYLIKLKVLFGVGLLSVSSLSLITLTSCGNWGGENNEIYKYIYDRTFSIARLDSTGHGVIGTGWLIKHIGDYQYEMFTNWHVEVGQETVNGHYYYGLEDKSTSFGGEITNYRMFQFQYQGVAKYYEENGLSLGVDAAIATVDFSGELLTSFLKARLDSLNAYADQHVGMLVQFASKHLVLNDDIYIAGYPVKKWDESNNSSKGLPCWWGGMDKVGKLANNFESKSISGGHAVDEPLHTKYSIGDEYVLYDQQTAKPRNTLINVGGGASGSMALNKDKELVGLYWGGFTDGEEKPKYFAPSIESFFSFKSTHSSSYSLYDDYKQGKWRN